jgi:hypothetical protein
LNVALPSPILPAQLLAELHGRQDQAIQAAMAVSPPAMEKAGIVIVAGGGQAFTNAWVALTILRDAQKSQLPIQVWHLGPDELSPVMRSLLSCFEVELVDAFRIRRRHPMRRLGPWECKVYATLHSRFRHVILLDADNVPLVDPQTLLDLPEYGTKGAIFWPDNHMHLSRSPVWQLFDVPYREELEVESGQLVVDKERCWVPLNLAVHYNAWSDIYYRYVYGDKETLLRVASPRPAVCHAGGTTTHGLLPSNDTARPAPDDRRARAGRLRGEHGLPSPHRGQMVTARHQSDDRATIHRHHLPRRAR